MRFTLDPGKNAANVRRHGIAFQDAARVFDGPTVERTDDRFDYGEARMRRDRFRDFGSRFES